LLKAEIKENSTLVECLGDWPSSLFKMTVKEQNKQNNIL
jgi:hypothetical protein